MAPAWQGNCFRHLHKSTILNGTNGKYICHLFILQKWFLKSLKSSETSWACYSWTTAVLKSRQATLRTVAVYKVTYELNDEYTQVNVSLTSVWTPHHQSSFLRGTPGQLEAWQSYKPGGHASQVHYFSCENRKTAEICQEAKTCNGPLHLQSLWQ